MNGRGVSRGGRHLALRGLGTHGRLERRGGHGGDRLPLSAVTTGKVAGGGGLALARCYPKGGGEGPGQRPRQRKADTDLGVAGVGVTASKQGRGSNDAQIQNNLN
jgi:hypothetical protein